MGHSAKTSSLLTLSQRWERPKGQGLPGTVDHVRWDGP